MRGYSARNIAHGCPRRDISCVGCAAALSPPGFRSTTRTNRHPEIVTRLFANAIPLGPVRKGKASSPGLRNARLTTVLVAKDILNAAKWRLKTGSPKKYQVLIGRDGVLPRWRQRLFWRSVSGWLVGWSRNVRRITLLGSLVRSWAVRRTVETRLARNIAQERNVAPVSRVWPCRLDSRPPEHYDHVPARLAHPGRHHPGWDRTGRPPGAVRGIVAGGLNIERSACLRVPLPFCH